MRTPAERGNIGNWLRDERLARGWKSQAEARRNLSRAGIVVAQSVYAEWESGTRIPSNGLLEKLRRYYGSDPAAASTAGSEALAQALMALTVELRESRLARERLESRLLALEAAAALQAKRDGEQPQGQAAHSPQPAQ